MYCVADDLAEGQEHRTWKSLEVLFGSEVAGNLLELGDAEGCE